MKLELAEFPVKQIRLGRRFAYDNGRLEVDEGALLDLIQQDTRIENVSLAVVAPGDKVRITGIRDLVEPRLKVSGTGQVFPGVISPLSDVGDGRTHRLSGMTVMVAAEYEGTIRAGTTIQRSAILDMSGPGAEVTRFSAYHHLVISFRIVEGLGELEAHHAFQQAECKVAQRLAQITENMTPAAIQTFDSPAKSSSLPKVMLIQGCITDPQHVHSGVGYYGLPFRESLATFVHPNEIFDGAITVDTTRSGRGYYPSTWDWQNHPLVLGLYAEHGRTLNFGGVILQRIRFDTAHGKEVGAQNTARLAKAMGADGALTTWIGGGNAFVDVMFTVRECERRGIKTTLVTYEGGGKQGTDSPILFYVAEADAVVSTGTQDVPLTVPRMEKVVGPYLEFNILPFPGAKAVSALGPLELDSRETMIGGADLWGQKEWRCVEY